jgi:hypothetical protein
MSRIVMVMLIINIGQCKGLSSGASSEYAYLLMSKRPRDVEYNGCRVRVSVHKLC